MIIPDFSPKGKRSYSPKSYTPSYSPKSYSPKSYTPSYSPKSYSPKSYTPSYSPKSYSPYSPKGYTPSYRGKEMYAPKKFHEKEMLVPKIQKSADPIMIIPGVTKGKGIFIPQDPMKIKREVKAVGDLVIPDICLENVPKVKDVVIPDAPKKVVPKVVPNKQMGKGMYYNPQKQQRAYNKGGYQKGYAPQPAYNKGGYQRGYAP